MDSTRNESTMGSQSDVLYPVVDITKLWKDTTTGQHITVAVRIHDSHRISQDVTILILRDGIHTLQAVVSSKRDVEPGNITDEKVHWCANLPHESIIRVAGLLRDVKDQPTTTSIKDKELLVHDVRLISESSKAAAIRTDATELSDTRQLCSTITEARLNNRVLDVRQVANHAIFQIQSIVTNLFINAMTESGFRFIHTPKLINAKLPGDEGFFQIDYFGKSAYLAQSPQYYKQMAISMDMKRVFEIGPLFRAEYENDSRHLTEFTGVDFEMVFENDYHEVLSFAESVIIQIVRTLQTNEEYRHLTTMVSQAYPQTEDFLLPPGGKPVRFTFLEAREMLKAAGVATGRDLDDLRSAEENALGRLIQSSHGTDFFTIEAFPRSIRPFYSHPHPENPLLCNSYDLFMRGQEVMSGSQRINSLEMLRESMKQNDPLLSPESEWSRFYCRAFEHGCAPHGGGGFGLNRVVQCFLGLPDIRDSTLFPRDPNRLAP